MAGGGAGVELVAGTIFAEDFRVLRLLSDGGMGSVYVVEQLSTGAERALKLMHTRLANDPMMRRRFEIEARVGSRIDSAHVVHVVAAGVDRDSGAPWLAMELLAGEDLNQYSRRVGPLTLAEVGIIFEQLCHALGAAHAAGIVHRDLKPENVFLAKVSKAASSAPYEIKVLDFGIAKLTAELAHGTDGGNTDTIGTPAWMAPEQTELGSTINPATDVWALGLIAFRLLTGKSFWRSSNVQGGNPDTLLREILYEMIPPATERAAEINRAQCLPKDFDLWFERCVIRAQHARFPDANIAWQTLSPVLSQTGALADTARWFKGGAAASSPPPPTRPSFASTPDRQPFTGPPPPPHYSGPSSIKPPLSFSPPPPASSGGSRGAVGAVIGAAVLLAVAGGAFAMRRYMLNETARTSPATIDASAFQPLPGATAPIEVDAAAASPPAVLGDLDDHRAKILVPAGTFQMGSNTGEDDERPVHAVPVQPFEIDTTEVTVAAYRACVNATRCSPAHAGEGCNASLADRDQHPINCIDWNQASTYCRAHGKRLPTEEEWELAARGPKASASHLYPWGAAAPSKQLCWNGEGNSEGKGKRASTCVVGTPEGDKSPYGVLGLAGNVSEWTASHYCPYPIASCTNPNRVVRGATWSDFAVASFRSTYRTRSLPNDANGSIGFRCAKSP